MKTPLAIRSFANAAAWEVWLAANQETSPGIWLRIAKKASERKSVSHPEALDVAICYGWIDGQRKSADDESFLQKFTPRGKRSIWSKINREKVDALIAAGRMQPAGKREVERAKADGRWEAAYDGQRTATVPDDLAAALAKNAKARRFFEQLNSQNRYAILFRIANAKKSETRARRIANFVAMLARSEKIYP